MFHIDNQQAIRRLLAPTYHEENHNRREHVMSTLYFGDCLDVMREHIPDESVDLIYLDPPFNSKRIYNASMGGAQWVAFKDTWQWYEAVDDFHELAADVSMASTMEGLRMILGEGSSLAYLSYMANRLRECHRVLKPTGSIYLHCDPTMSHYLKVLMDKVFTGGGGGNFRREIVWDIAVLSGYKTNAKNWIRGHDTLLYYTMSNDSVFNKQKQPHSEKYLARFNKKDETGRRYFDGRGSRRYLDEVMEQGKAVGDVWSDVMSFQQIPTAREKVGYPTQKPLALLERILNASSNPGDVVLDPFCGCGTTIEAAQRLDRQWIGIDVCVKACQVIRERLERSFFKIWSDVEFVGLPMTLHHASVLAEIDKFKFETWAASITPCIEANKAQVADKGIDGYGRIAIGKGKFIDLVSQVKGGSTGPSHIQAFNGARQQVGADLGIFTCFEDRVTTKMREAAASIGKYEGKWPVVQIYTVDDYFEGRQPQLPVGFS